MVPNARRSRKQRVGSLSLESNAPLTASGSSFPKPHSYAGRTQHLGELSRSPSVDIGQVPTLADLAGAAYSWDSHPSKTSAISQKSTTTRATAKSKEFFTFLFVNSVCDRQIVFLLGLQSVQTKSFQLQPTPVNQSQDHREKTSEFATQISNEIGSSTCNKNINGWSSLTAAHNWCTPE